MAKLRFSKDPKVKLVSIEEFFEQNNYLCEVTNDDIWTDKTIPDYDESYYKFTPNYLINIYYGCSMTNFGMDIREKLEGIVVAFRNGKTEYELIEKQLLELKEEKSKHKRSKKLDTKIKQLINIKEILPEYKVKIAPALKPFESYLIDTGYKTSIEGLKNKYLVFDVETNGIRKSNDDLLSLSIYDPTTGICYNRYFPLDLQPLVLTSFIHGLTDEILANECHMTQEEMDWLYQYFNLKDRILLSFSGGQGTFDSTFVCNYLKRQGIIGFEDLSFENIKNKIPTAPFGCEGQLSKDNLCRMFGIEGVNEVHSSYNDCILQWKLYEKLDSECVFFINESLYKYTPEYIIPYSYLFKHPDLVKYANINIPYVQGEATEISRLAFPKKLLKEIKKFPTNITGITIEHGINTYLKAEEQNNFEFLLRNKSHLKYVGSLDSRIKEIPIITEDDGTVKAIRPEDKEYIDSVNSVTKMIVEHIKPIADFLRINVFTEDKIMTQELSISEDNKVLALCDLSDIKSIVEIKTYGVLDDNGQLRKDLARQLFYQAKGRKTYVLSIKFDTHYNERTYDLVIDDLNVILYEVKLSLYDPSNIVRTATLGEIHINILKQIKKNPFISKTALSKALGISAKGVTRYLEVLETLKYIEKNNDSPKKEWVTLRTTRDKVTLYKVVNNEIIIIKK